MIKLENWEVVGWEHAIKGMRNPKNSWDRSDSAFERDIDAMAECSECPYGYDCEEHKYANCINIGPNDHKLMMQLAKGGPVHAKYRRMIVVYVDITAPLYWWKEFDTYKVGTVANSCSTMHKIHAKEFTLDDFSCDHLLADDDIEEEVTLEFKKVRGYLNSPVDDLKYDIEKLNMYRSMFLRTGDKKWWWQLIQRLPSSYNQKRTVMLNYEVLAGIYPMRKNHKLDEWHDFCAWIESLPYSEIITCKSGPDVLYLCDEKACDPCANMDCSHTSNIAHAKNFKEMLGSYWETESVSDCDIKEN